MVNGIKRFAENRLMKGESEGGSEVIQTVIVIGFAVGLGAALLTLQGGFNTTIKNSGTNVTDLFGKITAGKPAA